MTTVTPHTICLAANLSPLLIQLTDSHEESKVKGLSVLRWLLAGWGEVDLGSLKAASQNYLFSSPSPLSVTLVSLSPHLSLSLFLSLSPSHPLSCCLKGGGRGIQRMRSHKAPTVYLMSNRVFHVHHPSPWACPQTRGRYQYLPHIVEDQSKPSPLSWGTYTHTGPLSFSGRSR